MTEFYSLNSTQTDFVSFRALKCPPFCSQTSWYMCFHNSLKRVKFIPKTKFKTSEVQGNACFACLPPVISRMKRTFCIECLNSRSCIPGIFWERIIAGRIVEIGWLYTSMRCTEDAMETNLF